MENGSKIKTICVYGAGSNTLDQSYYDAAFELGRLAAKRGKAIVYGGGNTGVMGYLAEGASSEGGKVIGVAPEFMKPRGVLYGKCSEIIYTKDMRERKKVMDDLSDAFIVMPGGFGTLEEYFEVLTEKTLGLHTKPIALVNTNNIWDSLESLAVFFEDQGFITEACHRAYKVCATPEDALDFIDNDPGMDREAKWLKYVATEEDALG